MTLYLKPAESLSVKNPGKDPDIQSKQALTCAELLEKMDSDTTDKERFHEAVKRLEKYERNWSFGCSSYPSFQKDSASSESSSKDSENDYPTEKSLTWDSTRIKSSSQNAENLEYVVDSSMESDEFAEKSGHDLPIAKHHSYRQVWISEDEVEDNPSLI